MSIVPFCTFHLIKQGGGDLSSDHSYFKLDVLIRNLYAKTLQSDEGFHFFYEPSLIIRVSSHSVSVKIEKYLNAKNFDYFKYAYPIPDDQQHCYGEAQGQIVMQHLPLFTSIFHTHSVAALMLDPVDHDLYTRTILIHLIELTKLSKVKKSELLEDLASWKLSSDEVKIRDWQRENTDHEIVISEQNKQLLTTILEINKIAHACMTLDNFILYTERVIHTLFNPAGFSRNEEGLFLLKMADIYKEKKSCVII
jgi:hypothetical protein